MAIDSETGIMAATVAQRFYIDGDSKIQIASDLGLSRFKVARLLKQSVEEQIVEFAIHAPLAYDTVLSERIRKRFDLRQVLVVRLPEHEDDPARVRYKMGMAGAALLSELVSEQDAFGIGWGRTTSAMAREITTLAPCPIIQMGGIVGTSKENSLDLVRRISETGGGRAYPLFVPLVVRNSQTARNLRDEHSVAAAFGWFDSITVAAVSIGSWAPAASEMRDALEPSDRERVHEAGVVAEILGTFIRADGSVADVLGDRAIAMDYAQLLRIPNLMLMAGGAEKSRAVLAAFRAGLGDTLITDHRLAERLLEFDSCDY